MRSYLPQNMGINERTDMVSKQTVNAIKLCAVIAQRQTHMSCSTGQLSKQLGLSVSYIEVILKALKAAGIVSAYRGPGGGYKILGNLSKVSLWEIVCIFEADVLAPAPGTGLALQSLERGLQETMMATFNDFTLADFAKTLPDRMAPTEHISRFKFKPMSSPWTPKAPNSVFQLHMHS